VHPHLARHELPVHEPRERQLHRRRREPVVAERVLVPQPQHELVAVGVGDVEGRLGVPHRVLLVVDDLGLELLLAEARDAVRVGRFAGGSHARGFHDAHHEQQLLGLRLGGFRLLLRRGLLRLLLR